MTVFIEHSKPLLTAPNQNQSVLFHCLKLKENKRGATVEGGGGGKSWIVIHFFPPKFPPHTDHNISDIWE